MIKRCIQLAYNGLGTTYPNPLVGCVIVHDGKIIGEGWHQKAGEPHAEVRAIASVKDKSLLAESTLYVSLEPCSHYGKTPPCADLIITHRIPRVVIGTTDPFAKVAGRGIEKLRDAGCEVTVGVMEKECRELNKRFFTFHEKKRPYIFLKWAETADGFIAPAHKDTLAPVWITDVYTRQEVHKMRSEEQAILVGVGTVLADNPSLDTRDWYGKNPLRVIIDPHLRSPKEFKVWNDLQPTLFITNKEKVSDKNYGVQTEIISIDFTHNVPQQICDLLYQRNIQSLIVEGGAYTLQQFINAGLYDEMRIYKSEVSFGKGVKAPQIS
ncbi:bifunctional diaminohydroxyphosphoribosylaminopyrimidine deaminase/5-amino-6-(5-phosphoribosylamino)uracil reductase RibD [Capnocytophaga sputigena]|uniref:bifunctional diaminohydroxyphosphoribosylaminopyrimidine deaminase/5-amino-6-(5-phosphoribosylamino)uracil reductase RibD n=1 Tax=Capnocytophaga sputigena TaxID=1019 RepID=UPI000BB1AAD4|nr:bifunctional diaminohydroxyphosphoribosylaminopyrimidine deaminase/5-amino-6-(5-phosphoribosylamino)uracil reductase RibD [Capnocytophaga sputigena]ATA70340.1 riboflavin biosynthesis protein RibD [Capnocytophaga sputigena]PBN48024.1 riboflavin biosynthesis protein RibD [Capnocytophaga sputigena]VEI53759.1 Riboflavin biosynthesis protein RibD [Capnocytophaga sputigena]